MISHQEPPGDTITPQISSLAVSKVGSGATFTWTSTEFADNAVFMGVQSGSYTRTVADSFFFKLHEITVTKLDPRTTYFFPVCSADLTGNIGASTGCRIQVWSFLFLPPLHPCQ